ncbi:cytochrome P450 [Mycena filopes]|nr:cytochrome P450 [Mycena filopes]
MALVLSPPTQVFAVVVLALATWLLVPRQRRNSRLPLPPGPPGHWLFGTAIPKTHAHRKFEDWIKEYGPVISFRRGLELIVVIGRYNAAVEIMEKEGGSVADRPSSIAAGDTLSGGMRTLLIRNGERLRKLRKALHAQMRPTVAVEYQPIQQMNAQYHILDILEDPENHMVHAQGFAASVILSLTYGKQTRTASNDPIVNEVNGCLATLGAALLPGAYSVDAYPFLRYVPGYLTELRQQHQVELALFKSQLESVRTRMETPACFAKVIIERQKEYGLTWKTASAISIVILAAAAFPEAQSKVQQQLDAVVGAGKLPTFQDESDLVQVTAFYLESFRWRPVSAGGFAHRATRDIIWNGYVIPAGATVFGNHWSVARDPLVFPDPEGFNPQRWITPDGNAIREDLKVFQFGFGRRGLMLQTSTSARRCVLIPTDMLQCRSLFITTALLLWAFRISQNPKAPIDTLAFANTVNTYPLPFSVRFDPRQNVDDMKQLLKET